MKALNLFSILLFAALIFSACGGDATAPASNNNNSGSSSTPAADVKGQSAVSDDESSKNILQVALGSKDHSTLVAAVQAAGLEDVLVNAGPLTVFAPTNAAFDALPAGTVEDLLKPENKSQIVEHHQVPRLARQLPRQPAERRHAPLSSQRPLCESGEKR